MITITTLLSILVFSFGIFSFLPIPNPFHTEALECVLLPVGNNKTMKANCARECRQINQWY